MPVWELRDKAFWPDGSLYLLVDIWFGDTATGEPDLTEDFYLADMPRKNRVPITDAGGNWLLLDGTPVAPNVARTMDRSLFQMREEPQPVRPMIVRVIEKAIADAIRLDKRGDNSTGATRPITIGGVVTRQRGPGITQLIRTDRDGVLADAGEVRTR